MAGGPDDETVRWLRQLASDSTPIDELIRHRAVLLLKLPSVPDDPALRHGLDRLAMAVVRDPALAGRRSIAMELLSHVEANAGLQSLTQSWNLDELRDIAGGR